MKLKNKILPVLASLLLTILLTSGRMPVDFTTERRDFCIQEDEQTEN